MGERERGREIWAVRTLGFHFRGGFPGVSGPWVPSLGAIPHLCDLRMLEGDPDLLRL